MGPNAMLRLTLRTLLAWLDDVLSPGEIHDIGQQVQEAPAAQQLIERLRKVSRRRRLTVPEDNGPEGTDPNTVANYLDGALSPDDVRAYENKCLKSDVHLAEVASVHQILSLLGQKAKVPVDARHRMYRLPKGNDIPASRRPGGSAAAPEPHPVARLTADVPEVAHPPTPPSKLAASLLGAAALLLMVAGSGYYLFTNRLPAPEDKLALLQAELEQQADPEVPAPAAAELAAKAKAAEEAAKAPAPDAEAAPKAEEEKAEAEKAADADMKKGEAPAPDAEKKAQPEPPKLEAGVAGRLVSGEGAILKAKAEAEANWEPLAPDGSFAEGERIATLAPSRFLVRIGAGEATLWGGTELKAEPAGTAAARFELSTGRIVLEGVEGKKPYEVKIGPGSLSLIIPSGHAAGIERLIIPAPAAADGAPLPPASAALLAFKDEPIEVGIGDAPPKELAPGVYHIDFAKREAASFAGPAPDWVAAAELKPLDKEIAAQCRRYFDEKQPIGRSLTLALEDSNPIIRAAALKAAGTLGYVELVVSRLDKENDVDDRRAAADTLRDLALRDESARKKVDDELTARFGDQVSIIQALLPGIAPEKSKDPKTLGNLVTLLGHDSLAVRQLAIDNLMALTNRDDLGYDPDTRPADSIAEWAKVIRQKDDKKGQE